MNPEIRLVAMDIQERLERLYALQAQLADLHEPDRPHYPHPLRPPEEELDRIFANPFADKGAEEAAAVIAAAAAVAPPEELGAYRESARIRTEAFHRQFISGMAAVMACIEVSTNDTLHAMKRAARETGDEELIEEVRHYQRIVRSMRSDHGSNRRGRERRRAKRNAVQLAQGEGTRKAKNEARRGRAEENARLRRQMGGREKSAPAQSSSMPEAPAATTASSPNEKDVSP
jgi:hypothetical protein